MASRRSAFTRAPAYERLVKDQWKAVNPFQAAAGDSTNQARISQAWFIGGHPVNR
jgi:hypothetical protein